MPLQNTIESLTASHIERSKDDPNFQYQLGRIQAAERVRKLKIISLNIETRRKIRADELGDALKRENERRIALNIDPIESLDDIDDEDMPDVQLEQAAKIVTDLATMREVPVFPAQTAQVSP